MANRVDNPSRLQVEDAKVLARVEEVIAANEASQQEASQQDLAEEALAEEALAEDEDEAEDEATREVAVFGEATTGEVLIQDRFAEVRRLEDTSPQEAYTGPIHTVVIRPATGKKEDTGQRVARTFYGRNALRNALAFITSPPAKVVEFAEATKAGRWQASGFDSEAGFAQVTGPRREVMPITANVTEAGRRHRDSILSLARDGVERTCQKRARILPSQTGSFTVAVEANALESREKFRLALRMAKGAASYVRGSKSKAGQGSPAITTMRDGFEPPIHVDRVAITQEGMALASRLTPDSDLPANEWLASRNKAGEVIAPTPVEAEDTQVAGYISQESYPEAKRSLRVEVPNDCGEDVTAEVIADLAGLRGRAIPCHLCTRRYSFARFVEQVEAKIESPEQEVALAGLQVAYSAGAITEACPALFAVVGLDAPFVEASLDSEGKPLLE